MNPATSILFLGLVLSTAQGIEITSFKAEPDKPPKLSKVKLTATPDGPWKKCTVTSDTWGMGFDICDITKTGDEVNVPEAGDNAKYVCFAEKNGICGVTINEALPGLFKNCMTIAFF